MAKEAPKIKNITWKMTAYQILSVDPKSVDRHHEIKENYKLLAKKHHPDRGGVPAVFKAVNEAYSLIGDTAKRIEYDHRSKEGQMIDMADVIIDCKLEKIDPSNPEKNLPPVAHVPKDLVRPSRFGGILAEPTRQL